MFTINHQHIHRKLLQIGVTVSGGIAQGSRKHFDRLVRASSPSAHLHRLIDVLAQQLNSTQPCFDGC